VSHRPLMKHILEISERNLTVHVLQAAAIGHGLVGISLHLRAAIENDRSARCFLRYIYRGINRTCIKTLAGHGLAGTEGHKSHQVSRGFLRRYCACGRLVYISFFASY